MPEGSEIVVVLVPPEDMSAATPSTRRDDSM